MATRYRARVRAAAPRKLIWARTFQDLGTIPPATLTTFDLLEDFRLVNGGAMPIGSTVTRVRFDLKLVAPNDGLFRCHTGIIVEPAQGASATTLPSPADQTQADWMYFQTLFAVPENFALDDNVGNTSVTHTRDVKSQRKMEELGESLFFCMETNGTVGNLIGFLSASVLLRLP